MADYFTPPSTAAGMPSPPTGSWIHGTPTVTEQADEPAPPAPPQDVVEVTDLEAAILHLAEKLSSRLGGELVTEIQHILHPNQEAETNGSA